MRQWLWLGVGVFGWASLTPALAQAPAPSLVPHVQAGMVLDQSTGLVWARCSLGQEWSGSACVGEAKTYKFEGAQQAAREFNARGGLGGATDWVLPTVRQLQSLRQCSAGFDSQNEDFEDSASSVPMRCSDGSSRPTLSTLAFPNTVAETYWSSSRYLSSSDSAWVVGFYGGLVSYALNYDRYGGNRVRLVRASQFLGDAVAMGFLPLEQFQITQLTAPIQSTWQAQVGANVALRLKAWLGLRFVAKPADVPLPSLPPALSLKQDAFETHAEFEARVQAASVQRQQDIERLQASYRAEVERRNQAIDALQALQRQRQADTARQRAAYVQHATQQAIAQAVLTGAQVDQTTGDVLLVAGLPGQADALGKFAVKGLSRDERKALFEGYASHRPAFEVDVQPDGSFGLKALALNLGGRALAAAPTQAQFAAPTLLAAVVGADANNDALASVRKQNPNLVDKFEVGQVVYKDGSTAQVKYQDDLAPLITQTPAAPENSKVWLFAIGAEKYQNTDPINYARRSAEAFVQAAQKRFGIPAGHVVALYDEKATAGAIKGNLKRVLEQGINPGDTVIFYYNGHGIPVPEQDNQAYLLPTDAIPDYVAEDPDLRLSSLYQRFQESKAGQVLVVLDSCFTGQADGKSVFKGEKAATRLVPKRAAVDSQKMTILTAGTDKQYSSAYSDKGHRLFSYFLIKELLSERKTTQAIFDAVNAQVRAQSRKGGAQGWQDPQIQGNGQLALQ